MTSVPLTSLTKLTPALRGRGPTQPHTTLLWQYPGHCRALVGYQGLTSTLHKAQSSSTTNPPERDLTRCRGDTPQRGHPKKSSRDNPQCVFKVNRPSAELTSFPKNAHASRRWQLYARDHYHFSLQLQNFVLLNAVTFCITYGEF